MIESIIFVLYIRFLIIVYDYMITLPTFVSFIVSIEFIAPLKIHIDSILLCEN